MQEFIREINQSECRELETVARGENISPRKVLLKEIITYLKKPGFKLRAGY